MPPLDDATFEGCYRRVFPLVLSKCRRMVRDDAEAHDVAQEVFARLWAHRGVVQDPLALTAWLYRASTRLVIDRARQRALSRESLGHLQLLVQGSAPSDAESRLESREELRSVLASYPRAELEAAILNRVDQLTHPEVAEVMHSSERTVRRLLGRFDERTRSLKEMTTR